MNAERLWQRLQQARPLAARMALLSCLPVRVSPAFLRLARLRLLPQASTGEEADVWLSDLVETRSAAGFSYRRGVRDHLRQLLREDAELLDSVWHRVHLEHAMWLAPRARFEEELTWRLLRDAADPEIDHCWQRVVDELDGAANADGVARWVVRAVPELPPGTLMHPAGRRAFYGAHLLLGDASVLGEQTQRFIDAGEFAFATRRLPRRTLSVGLMPTGLIVSAGREIPEGHEIEIPATQPLWLQIEEAWPSASASSALPAERAITLDDGAVVHIEVGEQEFRIRSIDGASYFIKPSLKSTASSRRRHRVHIGYELELYGALKTIELPFVTGVMADLSGDRRDPLPALADRKFLEIDIDNFDDRMKQLGPRVAFQVPDTVNGEGELSIDLRFDGIDDFLPEAIAARVEVLAPLLAQRRALPAPSDIEAHSVDATAAAALDLALGRQLDTIVHHPAFRQLEAAWRGLYHLVFHTENDEMLKVRFLNVSKAELSEWLARYRGTAWDQSPLFKQVYEMEFGSFGGEPYGCLIGDYSFDHTPSDVSLLTDLGRIAAAAHAPFIAAASPALFGMSAWTEVDKPRDLARICETPGHAAWNALRQSEDARYLVLTLPRFIVRAPYGSVMVLDPEPSFTYVESGDAEDPSNRVFANAAYAMGTNIHNAFKLYGWCAAIRGIESGGRLDHLKVHAMPGEGPMADIKGCTEVAVTDRREHELVRLGLVPLAELNGGESAVFYSAPTLHRWNDAVPASPDADVEPDPDNRDAAQLPYVLAGSRIAQYLKCIVRDKIGSMPPDKDSLQRFLRHWLAQYVDVDSERSADLTKAQRPLASFDLDIEPGSVSGQRNAILLLRPHYQLEGMSGPIRIVVSLPDPFSA